MPKEQDWICAARRSLQKSGVNFFQASPAKYWTDFLLSLVLAYSAASVFLMSPLGLAVAIRRLSDRYLLALPLGLARA